MIRWLTKKVDCYETWIDVPRATIERVLETADDPQKVYRLDDFPGSVHLLLSPLCRRHGYQDDISTGKRIARIGIRGTAIAFAIGRALRVQYRRDPLRYRRAGFCRSAILKSFP